MAVNIQKQVDAVRNDTSLMSGLQSLMDTVLNDTNYEVCLDEIILGIISARGNLRSTRPENGYAAYLWRMVAFMISDNRAHNCIPCMADLYIPIEDREIRNQVIAILDTLDKRIVDQFKPSECTGLKAWKGLLI